VSQVEDLKAAALRLADQVDKEMAIMLACRERLATAHAECAEVFEGTSRTDVVDALVGISEAYTGLEDDAGKLGLSVHALQAYANSV
jgi:hypothetical protein